MPLIGLKVAGSGFTLVETRAASATSLGYLPPITIPNQSFLPQGVLQGESFGAWRKSAALRSWPFPVEDIGAWVESGRSTR